MDKGSRILTLGALIAGAAFVLGLAELLVLRFDYGDTYPPYSSFRPDPLGVRALYEALGSSEGMSVQRNLGPVRELGGGVGKTLFLCGASTSKDPESAIAEIEAFVGTGGRLVVSFYPLAEAEWRDEKSDEPKDAEAKDDSTEGKEDEPCDEKAAKAKDEDEDAGEEEAFRGARLVSIADRWGFSYAFDPLKNRVDGKAGRELVQKQVFEEQLPQWLSWHSGMYFDELPESWHTLYARDERSVIIERDWGAGSIVLCSDSYFLSNEALLFERNAALVSWLVGEPRRVVFNEAHLGVEERHGIMTLLRRYRLDGFIVAAIVLMLLFVWMNGTSLIPKQETLPRELGPAENHDVTSGLVNLLRRSVGPRQILGMCIEEWQRAAARGARGQQSNAAAGLGVMDREAARSAGEHGAVAVYQAIATVLADRKLRL